ncbi:NUDIX hydrolase [Bosea sp. SSUT16]|jgi:ADP-ribose pyrophosphatase|uniref:GDP-mannose pyrophosphatase n=2 Tax=Bosea TaxID=85413 RepID=A0A927EDZ6_9HYPH|nr:NUDIX hydrolase [Bosea spartocytisi]MBD3849039.1 NUDIX hydrolase [Bosea spartocytisi]MCT4470118.1 NUDIX hydrolase [Bosea spartocytisi]
MADPASDAKPEIATLSSRVVYANRWMTVREDAIQRQDGSHGIYGVVEKVDFVAIIPVEPDGSIHLVEQYRYPVGARFWELPQGSWELSPQADPVSVARGELREETGLHAEDMVKLGYLFECYGYSNQGCHLFLARRLRYEGSDLDLEEQGLVCRRFTASEVVAMIESGRIRDATTVAAIGLMMMKGLFPQGSGGTD